MKPAASKQPSSERVSFTVLGRAEPQGSVKAFMVKGRPRLTSDNAKMKPWRQQVGMMALAERGEFFAGKNQAVRLIVSFYLKPPVKLPKGRTRPTTKPDIDKLLRSIGDSLTGILWADDCQVCEVMAHKVYQVPEMTAITVELI